MGKHCRCVLWLVFLLGCTLALNAQKFVYDADALFFFDNREYHNPFDSSKTILGTRLSPEFGVLFRDSMGGTHRLMAGLQYVQPLNGAFQDVVLMPTIYYQLQTQHVNFIFGSFPMKHLMRPLPRVLLDDSLSYFYPNIRGALLRYAGKLGYVEASCDWFSMKTRQHPYEAFRLILNGELDYKVLNVGGYVASTHYTQPIERHRKIRVTDNLVLYPYIGANLSQITSLDSLSFQAAYLYSISRDRFQKDVMSGWALMADFYIAKTFFRRHAFGISNTFFWSENFMPMYYRFEENLYRGNPNFRAKLYNRTELFVDIVKYDFVDLRFSWVLHYIHGWQLGHQQLLTLDFHLGELPKVKAFNNRY